MARRIEMTCKLTPATLDELRDCTPVRMITLFYGEVLEKLDAAVVAIEEGDIARRCAMIGFAIELLGDILQCLDLESDDPLVENIVAVHGLLIRRLPLVNFNNDTAFLAQAATLVAPLRDAFDQVEKVERQQVQAAAARRAFQRARRRIAREQAARQQVEAHQLELAQA